MPFEKVNKLSDEVFLCVLNLDFFQLTMRNFLRGV